MPPSAARGTNGRGPTLPVFLAASSVRRAGERHRTQSLRVSPIGIRSERGTVALRYRRISAIFSAIFSAKVPCFSSRGASLCSPSAVIFVRLFFGLQSTRTVHRERPAHTRCGEHGFRKRQIKSATALASRVRGPKEQNIRAGPTLFPTVRVQSGPIARKGSSRSSFKSKEGRGTP